MRAVVAQRELRDCVTVSIDDPPDVVDALAVGVTNDLIIRETVERPTVVGRLDGAVAALDRANKVSVKCAAW